MLDEVNAWGKQLTKEQCTIVTSAVKEWTLLRFDPVSIDERRVTAAMATDCTTSSDTTATTTNSATATSATTTGGTLTIWIAVGRH